MEDEDGYMSIDPRKRDLCAATASKESKGSFSNLLWWKIALGISVAGNVVVVVLLILLSLPANLTLDPGTAFPQLYISEDQKTVTWKGMKQSVAPCTMRYDVMASVLSHEGFTSGKICWEVEVVEGGTWWGVGVVRESANRNGPIFLAPGGGYWGVQRIDGQYQAITEPRTNLSLCHPPKRIRVSLDYSVGQVAFFDGDTHAELFTFPKTHFSGERILPWFLIHGWNGKLMIHP